MSHAHKRSKLMVEALRLIVDDHEALHCLSAPARVLLESAQSSLEASLGKSLAHIDTEEMSAAVSESTAAQVVNTIADVISFVPIVGTVIAAILKFFSSLFGGGSSSEAEYCNRFLGHFKPEPSGSMLGGGTTVPADIFAAYHRIPHDDFFEGDECPDAFVRGVHWYPSALGAALMTMTEGCPADIWDLQHNFTGTRKNWNHRRQVAMAESDAVYKERYPKSSGYGLSKLRQSQFRALRRVIAHSWGPRLTKGAKSDGGLAFWPAYLDLLLHEMHKKRIPWKKDYWVIALQSRGEFYLSECANGNVDEGMFGEQDEYLAAGDPDRGCTSILTDQIRSMLKAWETSVHPHYMAGQAAYKQLRTQARKVATDAQLHAKAHPKKAPAKAPAKVAPVFVFRTLEEAPAGAQLAPELDDEGEADEGGANEAQPLAEADEAQPLAELDEPRQAAGPGGPRRRPPIRSRLLRFFTEGPELPATRVAGKNSTPHEGVKFYPYGPHGAGYYDNKNRWVGKHWPPKKKEKAKPKAKPKTAPPPAPAGATVPFGSAGALEALGGVPAPKPAPAPAPAPAAAKPAPVPAKPAGGAKRMVLTKDGPVTAPAPPKAAAPAAKPAETIDNAPAAKPAPKPAPAAKPAEAKPAAKPAEAAAGATAPPAQAEADKPAAKKKRPPLWVVGVGGATALGMALGLGVMLAPDEAGGVLGARHRP